MNESPQEEQLNLPKNIALIHEEERQADAILQHLKDGEIVVSNMDNTSKDLYDPNTFVIKHTSILVIRWKI